MDREVAFEIERGGVGHVDVVIGWHDNVKTIDFGRLF